MTATERPLRYRPTMKEMPADERPREKLRLRGAAALSNAELLAILLNTGVRGETVIEVAQRLLREHGDLSGLVRADLDELCQIHGLGVAKASKLKAGLELARRLSAISPQDRPQITAPGDVALMLGTEMSALDHEQLRVVLLDTKNRVMRVSMVYQGSVNSAQVRISEVFKDAIRSNAPSIVIVHNHPSGDTRPSRADISLTRDLVRAGELLGIEIIDHIILGGNDYLSLRREGHGFS